MLSEHVQGNAVAKTMAGFLTIYPIRKMRRVTPDKLLRPPLRPSARG